MTDAVENYKAVTPNSSRHQAFHREVLIVEDDPYWQSIYSRALRSIDKTAKVRCVRSAKQAQQLLYDNNHYDLIVADQNLDGDKTGLELWRACKPRLHDTPFVLVSAMSDDKISQLTEFDRRPPVFVSKSDAIDNFKSIVGPSLGYGKNEIRKNEGMLQRRVR